MGIRDRIKRRLPIIGSSGSAAPAASPRTAPVAAAPVVASSEPAAPAAAPVPVGEFIKELVTSNKVVLFMKGSPSSPQCGFSASAAGILSGYGHPLAHFDVLSDPEVRQGIKDFSEWPTIPQVYINGEFLGGSDILRQMHESGELKTCIEEAFAG